MYGYFRNCAINKKKSMICRVCDRVDLRKINFESLMFALTIRIIQYNDIPVIARFIKLIILKQVKLCDHLQFSHRKQAKPCDYSIRTNFNSCTENFYIDGFHVFNTYTGNIEHRIHNTHQY